MVDAFREKARSKAESELARDLDSALNRLAIRAGLPEIFAENVVGPVAPGYFLIRQVFEKPAPV